MGYGFTCAILHIYSPAAAYDHECLNVRDGQSDPKKKRKLNVKTILC